MDGLTALAERPTVVGAADLDAVYRFWFGEPAVAEPVAERVAFWMTRNDETDRQVREGFGHLLKPAAAASWRIAELTRQQGVSLIVLFDQFPRNLFRSSGEAFSYDHLARKLARQLVADGWERFTAAERFMLGLPFVHHEDEADQDYAVLLAAQEAVRATNGMRMQARFSLDQATRHRDIIRRFGRFPHRNAMLGRTSTAEESAFLATALNGRGF